MKRSWLPLLLVCLGTARADAGESNSTYVTTNESSLLAGVDWMEVRAEISEVLETFPGHDDHSIAPSVLRLAWHSAATFDPHATPCGGANGATMRFEPEASYPDNKGLELARLALEPIKRRHPAASYSDLWVLAGYLAVEHLGGPRIEFRPGRSDETTGGPRCPPDDRMPQVNDPSHAIRAKFQRMGLSDRDLVALMGAHSVGHTHPDNSGFPEHTWDGTPLKFDNRPHRYFSLLRSQPWMEDGGGSHKYFRNRSWIMLLTDHHLIEDDQLRKLVDEYAADEARWHKDFALAFKKLTEAGMPHSHLLE